MVWCFSYTVNVMNKLYMLGIVCYRQIIGIHLSKMISTVAQFLCITFLTYVYLDAFAASIISVTLLPLATVPLILRSSSSLDIAKEVQLSNEESNHVCTGGIVKCKSCRHCEHGVPSQVMFESILHIRTVTSFNLQNRFVEFFQSLLSRSCISIHKLCVYYFCKCREPSKRSVWVGLTCALVEVVQILKFAIVLRFGAYLVTLPSEHRFHTDFIKVFV